MANECSALNTRKTVFPQREQNPPFCLLVSLVHSRHAPEHLAGDTCPVTSLRTTCLFDMAHRIIQWPRVGGVGVGISEADFLPPSREMHDEQLAAKLAKASWGFRTTEDVLFMVSRFAADPASLLAWGMGDALTPPPFWFLRAYYLFLMVTFSSQLDLAWSYPREPPLGNCLHHTGLCSRLWGFFLIAR